MNKTGAIFTIFLAFVLAIGLVFIDNSGNVYYEAQDVYRVYLDGNSIGIIRSKSDLEAYINEKQNAIKEQYNVSRVYEPNNLKIEKEITYNEKISSVAEVYNKISNEKAFTIDGYIVTIKKKNDDLKLYVLDKNVFTDAINETVKSFVDKDKYDAYLREQQQDIVDEGTIIENVYIEELTGIRDMNKTNEVKSVVDIDKYR